jgi:acyl-CoA thioesterase FadM
MDRPAPGGTGLTFPMRAMSFDFLSFLVADDLFDMAVSVTGVSSRTFTLRIAATHDDGRDCFTCDMTGVCLDPVQRKSIPLPDEMRARLLAHQPASCN